MPARRPTNRGATSSKTIAAAPRHQDHWRGAPEGSHEWVSFPDPEEERTWMFDVTFLESRWTCIFGQGCQGVLTGPAPELVEGCCSYGAHFTGPKDVKRVVAAAATLTPEQWQYRDKAYRTAKRGRPDVVAHAKNGDMTTRLVKDACIFLNRADFAGGPGCALHKAAMDRGVPHLELKPDVCWQLPLRRDDEVAEDGHVTSIIRQWDRRDWGDGGFEFHWWCTEAPDAFVGTRPAYEGLADELTAMVSKKIFRRLVRFLEARAAALGAPAVAASSSDANGTETHDSDVNGAVRGSRPAGGAAPAGAPVPVRLPHPALRKKSRS